ncbi:MAG: glycosyltransferase [bacterium]|nr:glycosyltransferase [bacterium]
MNSGMATTVKQVIYEKSNDYTLLEKKYLDLTGTELVLDPFSEPTTQNNGKNLCVSVVLPSYNVRKSILQCLASIEQSSFNRKYQSKLQVIVVDDGSTDDTWDLIKNNPFNLHLTCVRQTNHGQARALNTGISVAEGDIVISCDPDMILSYFAIENFVCRHQLLPNVLLAGFRCNVEGDDSRVQFKTIREKGTLRHATYFNDERFLFPIKGWPSNMALASNHYKNLGYGKRIWMPGGGLWLLPDLVFGALFSLERSVYLEVGGYDERFSGWGCTDGYLSAKAISAGQTIIPIYGASGLHINHPFRTEDKRQEFRRNRGLFFRLLRTTDINHHKNWLVGAKKRIVESFTYTPDKSIELYDGFTNTQDNFLEELDNHLAIGKYEQVITSIGDKTLTGELSSRLGKALFGRQKYDNAISIFESILESDTPTTELRIDLAMAYAGDGQFTKAHSIINELSVINPNAPELLYWHSASAQKHIKQGSRYLEQGNYSVALRCFESALILEPKSKKASYYRDQCMEAQ